MKAVVLEAKNGHSAVLLENGTIERVSGEYEVGRTVELREVAPKKRRGKLHSFPVAGRIAAAAAAAVIVVSGTGTMYYETAYACTFVSVDVNPSIEFSLNRRDQVIGVEPKNEDAEPIVAMLLENDVKGDTLVEAISKTKEAVKELDFGDYSIGETYLVDITSDSDARMAKLSREVEEAFREEIRLDGEETPQMVVVTSTVEDRKTAQSLGISTGRYSALKQAMSDKEQAEITTEDVDEYRNKTIKDIVKKTDNNIVAEKDGIALSAATTAVSKPAPAVAPQPEPEPEVQVSEPEPEHAETPAPAAKTGKNNKKKKKSAEAATASTEGKTGDEAGEAASGAAGTGKSGEAESAEAASTGATEGNTGETAVAAATTTGEGTGATTASANPGAADPAAAAATVAAPADPATAATAENPAAAATAAPAEQPAEQPAEPTPAPAETPAPTSNDAGTGSGAATQEKPESAENAAAQTGATGP
ncbi:MAG: hypothetical protein II800_03960 [Lachnospiraceae bacterium]|nr:hypothetical protein [Lachnospiraceae bacterium]